MKRIASTAAVVALGLVPALGVAGTAHSSPTQSSEQAAIPACGFNATAQEYTNCAPAPDKVAIFFYDSIAGAPGNTYVCAPVGTTPIISLIGPGRLASVGESMGEPC